MYVDSYCGDQAKVSRSAGEMLAPVVELGLEISQLRELTGRTAPTVITYNALISACAYAGQWRRALDVFEKDMPHAGVDPSRVSHVSLQDALWAGRQ